MAQVCHVWMVLRLWFNQGLGNQQGAGVLLSYCLSSPVQQVYQTAFSFRAEQQGQLKPIDRRAVQVQKEYCKAAKDPDSKYHHIPDNENCPAKSALLSYGPVAAGAPTGRGRWPHARALSGRVHKITAPCPPCLGRASKITKPCLPCHSSNCFFLFPFYKFRHPGALPGLDREHFPT